MKRIVVVLAVVGFALAAAAAVMAYVALKRTGPSGEGEYSRLTLPERVDRLEVERMHFSVFLSHQEEELRVRKTITERIESVEQSLELIGKQIVFLQAPKVRQRAVASRNIERAPSSRWWCYFGRECFRSKDACANGDPTRDAECKPARQAWCGGTDGKACFANLQDCLDLDARLTVVENKNARPCAAVE